MNIQVWYSTESFADYIIEHTVLKKHACTKCLLQESDASKPRGFHAVPDHIKKILYLDAPDIIVEVDSDPIFSIEISKEAGTGHNVFQRFPRLVASAENGIPSFYIYSEAVIIPRKYKGKFKYSWDAINPLICHALERLMSVFNTPALLFFYPSHYKGNRDCARMLSNKGLKNCREKGAKFMDCPEVDSEMTALFRCINLIVSQVEKAGLSAIRGPIMGFEPFKKRREWMAQYLYTHNDKPLDALSPLSAVVEVDTDVILNYLLKMSGMNRISGVIPSRPRTIIYCADSNFRADPYMGALASIDYMRCRNGKTFEDRDYNLVMAWGKVAVKENRLHITGHASINDFSRHLKKIGSRNLLSRSYTEIRRKKCIPRYYMQARYGSTFTKAKEIRISSYFCDAILFRNGVLWREG